MPDNRVFKLSAALTGAICVIAASQPASAGDNPFAMTPLSDGYKMVAEGKCGEGKCGGGMNTDKGGEGKCGMQRMDADGDGKVTKEEFMQGHEAMFDTIDTDGDGVLNADERSAHMAMKRATKGKCRQGK